MATQSVDEKVPFGGGIGLGDTVKDRHGGQRFYVRCTLPTEPLKRERRRAILTKA